jgi:DNA replication protein DnaC
MLIQPLLQQLHELRLRGMACGLEQQLSSSTSTELSFEERLGLLLQHELLERQACRLRQRLRWAKFPQTAALEDLDLKAARGIDRSALTQVTNLAWIGEHLNVLLTGPTGVGKSFIACAIGHAACRADYSVRCFRVARLVDELLRHTALQSKSTFLRQLAKADLLIVDDFGLSPLPDPIRRDLLEILDDRYDRRSTLITSQLPVEQWHAYLEDPTLADAILDRLIHNSYRLALKGDSMRKQKTTLSNPKTTKSHGRTPTPERQYQRPALTGPSCPGTLARHPMESQAGMRGIRKYRQGRGRAPHRVLRHAAARAVSQQFGNPHGPPGTCAASGSKPIHPAHHRPAGALHTQAPNRSGPHTSSERARVGRRCHAAEPCEAGGARSRSPVHRSAGARTARTGCAVECGLWYHQSSPAKQMMDSPRTARSAGDPGWGSAGGRSHPT